MDVETNVGQLASIAQNEAIWTRFVRSGQIFLVEEAMLHRAQRDLERRLTVEKGPKGPRERRMRGAARIRGYIIGHRQPF
jgi:hypothetical protein